MTDDNAVLGAANNGGYPSGLTPGWYVSEPGQLRWWDGLSWTEHSAPTNPPADPFLITPTFVPSRRVDRRWWAVTAVLLLALGAVASFALHHRSSLRPASVIRVTRAQPDGNLSQDVAYRSFGGGHGLAVTDGAPWGQPCKPVLLEVAANVPDAVFAEADRVVREARTGGLDIALSTRSLQWRPSDLYPAGLTIADVARAPIFADTSPGHLRADGQPTREDVGWDTALEPDGRSEYLTSMQVKLHLANLGGDPLAYRRALRKFIGWTQGIADSSDAGSALKLHSTHAPDGFTPADMSAMKRMSGCTGS